MLDALRRGASTWIAKLLIALLVMSFAVWGISGVFTNLGQNVVASVGDTDISTLDFERAYRADLNNFGRQIGRPLTASEGASLGIPQQTLSRLAAQAAMNDKASTFNLGISDDFLAKEIQEDPNLQRSGGGFDRALLASVLRGNGMTESEFVLDRRELAERQQLAQGLVGGMPAPETYLEVLNRYQEETRDLSYLVVDASSVGTVDAPADDALAAYFEENKDTFRAPEYRAVSLLELSAAKLARPGDITEDAISAEYDRTKDRFTRPERRKIQQMAFTSKEEAEAAAAELSSGKTFADLMAEKNLTAADVDLGEMSKADILDATISDAAFASSEAGTTGVVEGRFSTVILNITEILPESIEPLADVADDIRANLANEQAEREVLDLMAEVEDARAGGSTLEEVSSRFDLELVKAVPFDRSGKDEAGEEVTLPATEELLAGAFDSDVGIENDPIELGDRGFLWYEVSEVIPERDRTLDEVREKVVAAWTADETAKRVAALAEEIAEKARGGTSLLKLSRELGSNVQTKVGLKRNAAAEGLTPDAVTEAFNGVANRIFVADGTADGAKVVLRVNSITTPGFFPEAEQIQTYKAQLSQQLQDSLLSLYITRVEDEAGLSVNNNTVNQLIGLMSTQGQ